VIHQHGHPDNQATEKHAGHRAAKRNSKKKNKNRNESKRDEEKRLRCRINRPGRQGLDAGNRVTISSRCSVSTSNG